MPPRNSHGDGPFLRPPERVPEVPVKFRKIHVNTGEESSGSDPESTQGLRPRHRRERNPERPRRNSHGDWPFLRPPERVPEIPFIVMRDPFAGGRERILGVPVTSQEEALSTGKARDQEESAPACPLSRRELTPLGRLHNYPMIHVIIGEESSGSGPDSTQLLRPRHRRERNHERPPSNTHDDWPFLRPPERVPEVPVVT
ncbi:hypothetical protein R6Z07M_007354 [Ovis aries]